MGRKFSQNVNRRVLPLFQNPDFLTSSYHGLVFEELQRPPVLQ